MTEEFNLSEKIRTDGSYQDIHVKEFIKIILDEINLMYGLEELQKFIKNKAGEKLTKWKKKMKVKKFIKENKEEIKHLESKYAMDDAFSKEENKSRDTGDNGNTSPLQGEDSGRN